MNSHINYRYFILVDSSHFYDCKCNLDYMNNLQDREFINCLTESSANVGTEDVYVQHRFCTAELTAH